MELQFYSKGPRLNEQKAEFAKIFLYGDDWMSEYEDGENKFVRTDEKVGEVPIFISQVIYGCANTLDQKENYKRLFKEKAPDAILVCRLECFKQIVWYSNNAEMNPNIMVVGSKRVILYYAFIGKDKSTLLVAEETSDD